MKTTITLAIAILFHSLTHQAEATAPAVSGAVQLLTSPPSSVDIGDLESNSESFLFLEQAGIVLPPNLQVNIIDPGSYNGPSVGTVHVLPGGELVDTYFLHFDPVGALDVSDPAVFSQGMITFDREVIAIITRDWPLSVSENLGLGAPTTLYPAQGTAPGRGVDTPINDTDHIQLSSDRHTVSFIFGARHPGDQMRIILASQVPEPTSWLLWTLCAVARLQVRGRPALGLPKTTPLQTRLLQPHLAPAQETVVDQLPLRSRPERLFGCG